ncbi:MAG: glycoside hydrolase family 28 protein [Clostridia bacterium]|nr:glycoside hydrolase family 28 protein [Clostridia bacterium]
MNILDYAAYSCGGSDWTHAFEKAIFDLRRQGGGTLHVPAGLYPTGPVRLYDDMALDVEAGAELRFHRDENAYPLVEMEYEGKKCMMHMPCVFAVDAKRVTLTGRGTLNGQGDHWWPRVFDHSLEHPRPHLVAFYRCEDVVLENLRLINSAVWTVHPLRCKNVVIRGLYIKNPYESPNTDGIDPDSCTDVRISDCTIDVGDDCIAIKSGTETTPEKEACERIIITGCHFLRGHGGVVLGSEMSGGIKNVVVSSCVFYGTDRGVRLKTRRGRGGTVECVQMSDLVMENVVSPFVFNMYYYVGRDERMRHVWDKNALPVDGGTPRLKDVSISGVRARGCTSCAGFFYGLPEMPIDGVTLSDVVIEMGDGYIEDPGMMNDCPRLVKAGFFMRNVKRFTLNRVKVLNAVGETLDADESAQAEA